MVDANDNVETRAELKAPHIGQVQWSSLWQFLAGHSQHARRYIQAAHLVPAGERSNDTASSAGYLKQRRSLTVSMLDSVVNKGDFGNGVTGHGIVMPGKHVIKFHIISLCRT